MPSEPYFFNRNQTYQIFHMYKMYKTNPEKTVKKS